MNDPPLNQRGTIHLDFVKDNVVIKILEVRKNSLADNAGIREEDLLIALNDHPVNDFLDYYFYQSEESLTVEFNHSGKRCRVDVEKSYEEDLGLELEDIKIRSCSNNCVFCFIKQNPPKMRRQIYFCDEDYRYSFLYGNYITLTEMNDKDLDRISEQRLSPLYISVHATDPDVRKAIFRFKSEDRLMEKIAFLTQNRIELHTQVVLVPGLNDGKILQKTIEDLYQFKESIKTLAIVPVGLTRHRRRLPEIKTVTSELARGLLKQSRKWNRDYQNNEGDPFVYLSDEFYLLSEESLPESAHYGPYYQLENGVGLCRRLIDSIDQHRIVNISKPLNITLITGKLAEPVLREFVLPYLNGQAKLTADLLSIDNRFFGNSVTVSGLLTGRDILNQLPKDFTSDCIFLPPNCINEDGALLDDMTPQDIFGETGVPVRIGNYNIEEMVNQLEK